MEFERRKLVKWIGLGGLALKAGLPTAAAKPIDLAQRTPTPACADETPPQIEGPFYTPSSPRRVDLREPGQKGELLRLSGRVLDSLCKPVAGAIVDLWGCDAQGVYDNVGFRLRGHQVTDANGQFEFLTVFPGAYGNAFFRRTPHLHVKVKGGDAPLLTTQLYFPEQNLNSSDGFFDPALLIRMERGKDGRHGFFEFVLATGKTQG